MAIIRIAQQGDVEALLTLAQGFATSFVVDPKAFDIALSEILASPSAYLAVAIGAPHKKATTDTDVVGYVLGFKHYTFYANGQVAWVEEIVVHQDFRRMGIGTLLMQSFEEWAAHQDAKLVALATRRAAVFYQALGYEESALYLRKLL